MNEEKKERDYPEVQFTLAGDEGKSEEQIQKEIENGYKIISMTPIIQGNWTSYMIVVFETEE